jgi:hypothetical protein
LDGADRRTWVLAFVTAPSRELDLGAELHRRLALATRSLLAAGAVFSAIAGIHCLRALLFATLRASRVYPSEALRYELGGAL